METAKRPRLLPAAAVSSREQLEHLWERLGQERPALAREVASFVPLPEPFLCDSILVRLRAKRLELLVSPSNIRWKRWNASTAQRCRAPTQELADKFRSRYCWETNLAIAMSSLWLKCRSELKQRRRGPDEPTALQMVLESTPNRGSPKQMRIEIEAPVSWSRTIWVRVDTDARTLPTGPAGCPAGYVIVAKPPGKNNMGDLEYQEDQDDQDDQMARSKWEVSGFMGNLPCDVHGWAHREALQTLLYSDKEVKFKVSTVPPTDFDNCEIEIGLTTERSEGIVRNRSRP